MRFKKMFHKNTFKRLWPATDNKHFYVFLVGICVLFKHIFTMRMGVFRLYTKADLSQVSLKVFGENTENNKKKNTATWV